MNDFMKKGNLAWLMAGIGIGVFLGAYVAKRASAGGMNNASGSIEGYYQKGDKAKEIEEFQHNLNIITGRQYVPVTGTYCSKTANAVGQVLNGTFALSDIELGRVRKDFVNDFNTMFKNVIN